MPRDVHLIGSVPMASAREVFETVSAALGPRLPRIPDGETGERLDWITWLEPVFAGNPALEKSDEVFRVHATGVARTRYQLKPGVVAKDVRFGNLFYADHAIRSYRDFAALKREGKIPPRTRFQVDLVPAHSVIWLFLQDDLHAPLDPVYNEAVKREIDKLAAAIPHAELAIQFDVASAVFARLERNDVSSYGRGKAEMQERFSAILIDLGNRVPNDIELIHMPVPRGRSDDAYFAPLKALRLKPGTKLCLGLVHHTDGVAGTRTRMAAAQKHVQDFSIATECGFGRRRPETIAELLRIHAEAAL